MPVRTIHSGPNPRYFGHERGVTWYNLASDQFTGLNAITIPGTLRDSLYLLALVLEQETELSPTEIMTDTAAYTDTIFGIFHLLGYSSALASPRSVAPASGVWTGKPITACSTISRRTRSTCASSSITGMIFCALPAR